MCVLSVITLYLKNIFIPNSIVFDLSSNGK